MTEPNTADIKPRQERLAEPKPVDLAAEDSPLRQMLGARLGGALVVDVALGKDGQLTRDSLGRIRQAIEGRMREQGAPPSAAAKLLKLFQRAEENPALAAEIQDAGRKDREQKQIDAINAGMRGAKKLLDGLPEEVRTLAKIRAIHGTDNKGETARYAYQLGQVGGAIVSALSELGGGLELFEHATTCECMHGDDVHGDEDAAEPPAPAPAAEQPAPAPEGA